MGERSSAIYFLPGIYTFDPSLHNQHLYIYNLSISQHRSLTISLFIPPAKLDTHSFNLILTLFCVICSYITLSTSFQWGNALGILGRNFLLLQPPDIRCGSHDLDKPIRILVSLPIFMMPFLEVDVEGHYTTRCHAGNDGSVETKKMNRVG